MISQYSIRIRWLLPIIVLSALAVMVTVSSLWHYQAETAQLELHTDEIIKERMASLQHRLEGLLRLDQSGLIAEEIAEAGGNLNINSLALTDEHGQVMFATRHLWLGKAMTEAMPELNTKLFAQVQQDRQLKIDFDISHEHLTAYQPISLATRPGEIRPNRIGVLLLDYSLVAANAGIREELWEEGIVNLIIGAVTMFLLMLALQRKLSQPLIILINTFKSISRGNFSARVNFNGSHELVELGEAVNKMQLDLANAQTESLSLILQLQAREKDLQKITDTLPGPILRFDENGRCIFVSGAYQRWFGIAAEKVIGKSLRDLLDPHLYAQHDPHLERVLAGEQSTFEISLANSEKEKRDVMVTLLPDFDIKGKVCGYYIIDVDITERKMAEEKIHHLAFYDALTLLPNRRLLNDHLRRAMATGTRNMQYAALLFIDLDNFKSLNDTQGHSIGDMLLIEAARRIQTCVREVDTVARLGGDEFVIIVGDLSENREQAASQAMQVGEKVRESLAQVYTLNEMEHHSSASLGISLFIGETIGLDDLLMHADTALYQAKNAGRNTLRFFDPQMQAELGIRILLETDLRHALAKQQFDLHYQPQVDTKGKIIGAEALLRWLHPQRGQVAPMEFIQIAEANGMIVPIGFWVLQTACSQIKTWQEKTNTEHLQLAVNVSARQFRQPDFVEKVMEAIHTSGIDPQYLKLELTESLVLDNISDSIAKMLELRNAGVLCSMDDFGTGQSSLTYLRRLPLSQLKIDQSFVRDIGVDEGDAAIVKTIITMAINLGMGVIAEGVETAQQREFLEQNGCYFYQGYLFGKPMPIEAFNSLLEATFA